LGGRSDGIVSATATNAYAALRTILRTVADLLREFGRRRGLGAKIRGHRRPRNKANFVEQRHKRIRAAGPAPPGQQSEPSGAFAEDETIGSPIRRSRVFYGTARWPRRLAPRRGEALVKPKLSQRITVRESF